MPSAVPLLPWQPHPEPAGGQRAAELRQPEQSRLKRKQLRDPSPSYRDWSTLINRLRNTGDELLRWADPGGMPGAQQSSSITPLLTWTGEAC